ncbi:MAG: hypothetical protein A2664_02075 [Candidatus Taylorbacteria bacterium RIFCSPHIGHO2_01_FULL_46_22b]|uniref:General secretion pathway GspH domain-containing protein n=1 Tax=Candidatus Taylorbacteria bacterium RIFCSPHIGHO2_01_FULL_46_22b TaxID=1802301 RepID=A0A1G2M2X0_9BACT|nr:MAG: hypothetical protein A2664_02075 [Candidatus Taylorbacteria bacterium RIFCSPHIGHO2_01_FULL_46_22b]
MTFHLKEKRNSVRRGFTLIELLVVLSIIMVITVIASYGKTRYERSIYLTNLSYDVALAVREAQLYGVNVRRGVGADYDYGYGVHFSTSQPSSFQLFVDSDNDHYYDGVSELVRNYGVTNNHRVSALCTVAVGSSLCVAVTTLDITFRRPDPDACINTGVSYCSVGPATATCIPSNQTAKLSSSCIVATAKSEGRITVSSDDPSVPTHTIKVYSTGQISVQ